MTAEILQVEKGRMIVLVPESLVPDTQMMNQIYAMARRENREVYYLALVDNEAEMLTAARTLATLKALVSGGGISAASRVVESARWLEALREIYRPGDSIVCQAEQTVRSGFFRTAPASEFLRAELQAPVRTLAGYYHPVRAQLQQWLGGLVYWAGVLAIIGAFFFLEITLDRGVHGAAHGILLLILLLAALAAGVAWNKISDYL